MKLSVSVRGNILRGIILKLIALAGAIYGIFHYLKHAGSVLFVFTYYTNISNAFMIIVFTVSLLISIVSLIKGSIINIRWFNILKFCATMAMIVTFLVYALVLAPRNAVWFDAYRDYEYGSLGVHMVAPVFAVLDLFCSDTGYAPKPRHGFYTLIQPVLYIAYIAMLALDFGARWPGKMYAPYSFMNFGSSTGWFGFKPEQANSVSTGIGVAYILIGAVIAQFLLSEIIIALLRLRNKKIRK